MSQSAAKIRRPGELKSHCEFAGMARRVMREELGG
jgi:hypothetical protein